MSFWRTFLLVIISVLLFLSLIAFSTFGSFSILLYRHVYLDAFENNGVYEIFNDANSTDIFGPGGAFVEIPEEGYEPIIESLLKNFFFYIRSESDELNLDLKLNSDALREFFLKSANNFPICKANQQPFKGTDVICRPSNQSSEDFLDDILEVKNITILEDGYVDLAEVYGLKEENLNKARTYVTYYKVSLYGTLVLGLILLSVLILVNKKELQKGLRWSGVSLIVTGTIIVAAAFTGFSLLLKNLSFDFDLARGVILDIANAVIRREKVYGYIITATGLTLFVSSFFIKKKTKTSSK